MSAIGSESGHQNVLANIRQDWRNLHSHPWVDDGTRRTALRRYIRGAIARVRAYRAKQPGGVL
jgi:hypothetical protein